MKLIDVSDFSKDNILSLWRAVDASVVAHTAARVAWSFEGNGIRTRTSFLQAFTQLGAHYIELPNLLKSSESVADLAGYLDEYYDIYVIRERNHERLSAFADASKRPVINAMSDLAHPCEVLTDAFWLFQRFTELENVRILLWGPLTNVLRSWRALAEVYGLNMSHYRPSDDIPIRDCVQDLSSPDGRFDVVITDAWPSGFQHPDFSLSFSQLADLGDPVLLPTPPVTVGQEVNFPPVEYPQFSGYGQKALLLPVQRQIVHQLLAHAKR